MKAPHRIFYEPELALLCTYDEKSNLFRNQRGETVYALDFTDNITEKHGYYGIRASSDLPGHDSKEYWAIAPAYRKLQAEWDYMQVVALGKNKKFGIIAFNGDTLVPFEYDDITALDEENEGEYSDQRHYFQLRKGKKYGLYNMAARCLVPAVFDAVYPDETVGFITRNGEKYGLYDFSLNHALPEEYDAVLGGFVGAAPLLEVQRNGKWQVAPIASGHLPRKYELEITPAYDVVVGNAGYIADSSGFVGHNLLDPNEAGRFTRIPLFPNVAMRNGKLIICEKGKQLHKRTFTLLQSANRNPEEDTDIVFSFQDGELHYFMLYSSDSYSRKEW